MKNDILRDNPRSLSDVLDDECLLDDEDLWGTDNGFNDLYYDILISKILNDESEC